MLIQLLLKVKKTSIIVTFLYLNGLTENNREIMKNLLLIILCLFMTTRCTQDSNIKKDIKMYEQVWNDIVNKGEIELINEKHFDSNVIMVLNT